MGVEAVPFFIVLLLDLSQLFGSLRGWSFLMFSALSFRFAAPSVSFSSLLLSSQGKRFPLLSALLCCGFPALRALLCFFGTLCSFGFTFFFLPQGTLARGFAGSGR
jgi:hypothetical protein